ncbi:MAG: putative nitrogen fixation protein NifT [Gloeocapsa sp. DLM2.Bin57]|nr:MAG: putative nitrogen fixation protein NifT [Gloeocapsa sp. DLM2.Bin57]
MKVMLRRNKAGHLIAYVAKKDLEEEVVNSAETNAGTILTLANGWELEFSDFKFSEDLVLPQTLEGRKL